MCQMWLLGDCGSSVVLSEKFTYNASVSELANCTADADTLVYGSQAETVRDQLTEANNYFSEIFDQLQDDDRYVCKV